MVPRKPSGDDPQPGDDVLARFTELITGLGLDDLRAVAEQVMAAASAPADRAFADLREARPPERRRARRDDEVTYRVRVDLSGAKPPIWRRLEVGSQMSLDALHEVIQTAFGWTDSHLHMFALALSAWDRGAQRYLCAFDVEESEDEDPIPEQDVRLDEVLVEPGDRLHYVYDYGDGWEHVLRLEAVVELAPVARARCTDGRRAGPPEDCGGIWGYQEMVAGGLDGDEPDLEEVNASLSVRAAAGSAASVSLGSVGAVLRRLRGQSVGMEFEQLLGEAKLDRPVLVDPTQASAMVERYLWLLDAVGDTGVRLTSAGYLPPRVVEAAWAALDLGEEWIGSGNREVHTLPLLTLRESAQRLGLLRKSRGELLATRAGQRLRHDPVALWWHLAARLGPDDTDAFDGHASLVTLVGVAAGRDVDTDPFEQLRTDVLSGLGWRPQGGGQLDRYAGLRGARDTLAVLMHLSAFSAPRRSWKRGTPTAGGRALARAALRGST